MQEPNVQAEPPIEPKRTIAKVWDDPMFRKVFLDIINQTQLKRCKQLRGPFVKKISTCLRRGMTDEEIYRQMRMFIETVSPELKRHIQHQGHYRGVNRSVKIIDFVKEFHPLNVSRVLDVGCGDGSITKALKQRLSDLHQGVEVHGCDIVPIEAKDFTFSLISQRGSRLNYPDGHFDVVYALMSLHHIRDLNVMLGEIYRVMKPGGLLIVREHDCVSSQLSDVLDIVHGFYSMVWCTPQEHESFENEYFGHYRTAQAFDEIIGSQANFVRLLGTNRIEDFPIISHGKVVNPMKHYWVVYSKTK